MKKMTLEHVNAVNTAKLNLIRLTDRDTNARFKAEIEKRIAQLGEVAWWILESIYHPELPFDEQAKNATRHLPEKPQDDGAKTK